MLGLDPSDAAGADPGGPDPHHWRHFRVRGGENNADFAFANVCDAANVYPGLSGVFGPDTFAFPRREAIVADGEGIATVEIDSGHLDSASGQRRQAKRSRLHARAALVSCAGANEGGQFLSVARGIRSKMKRKRRGMRSGVGCDSAIHISAQASQKVLARDTASHYLTTTPAGHR